MLTRVVSIFLVFFFSLFYSYHYRQVPIAHHDEAVRVGRGYMLELAINKDFSNPLWFTLDGYDEPIFVQYVYGAMLYKSYLREKSELGTKDYLTFMIDHNLYDVKKLDGDPALDSYFKYQLAKKNFIYWHQALDFTDEEYIQQYGPQMSQTLNLIYDARRVNIVVMTITSVLVYCTALMFFPVLESMLISLWFGTNRVIFVSGLKAMNEGFFLLFFIYGVYLLIDYFRVRTFSYNKALFIGIIAGMCANAKLNGVLITIFFIVLSLPYMYTRNIKEYVLQWRILKVMGLVMIATYVVFVLGNPFTYPSIIKNSYEMYRFRWEMSSFDRKEGRVYMSGYTDRFKMMYTNYFNPRTVKYFTLPMMLESVPPTFIAIWAKVFFILGTVVCLRRWRDIKMRAFLVIAILTTIAMLLYLSIPLTSYYVPLSFFILWFEAVGALSLWELAIWLFERIKKFGKVNRIG